MDQDKYVFTQLTDFLSYDDFFYILKKHEGNKSILYFTCCNQLLTMMFGQLSNCDSMQDLCILIDAHYQKAYRLGFEKSIALSTLARANANHSYKIFEEFASLDCKSTKMLCRYCDLDLKVDGRVYALDSSNISLCLNVFWQATYKRPKGAIKLYTLYDIRTQIPDFVIVTPASVNDVNGMELINYQQGSYYIFDRGYNDFARLYNIHIHKAFFVFRACDGVKFRRI
jgi:hypothetical protein